MPAVSFRFHSDVNQQEFAWVLDNRGVRWQPDGYYTIVVEHPDEDTRHYAAGLNAEIKEI